METKNLGKHGPLDAEEDKKQKTIDTSEPRERCTGLSETGKKTLTGIVIVIFLAISWVGAQQFAQNAVRLNCFDAPYFATWFGTCWMIFCYPGYVIFALLSERSKEGFIANVRRSTYLFSCKRITVAQFFKIICPLNVLWLAVNYLYIFGLKFILATVASAIMASNVAFVYILSLFVLHEKLFAIRIAASALCIGGVMLFGFAEGFGGTKDMLTGVLLIVASAFGAAVYKVVFKKVVGDATLGQVSLFLTLLGISNILIMWTVSIILYVAKVEQFSSDDIPWEPLILSAILSLIFNFLVNFGIAYTYPLFISIAMMIGIPLNAGVDVIVRHSTFSASRLVATALVFSGFAIMLFPDAWNDPIHSLMPCKIRNPRRSVVDELGFGKTVTENLLIGDSQGGIPLKEKANSSSHEIVE